MQRLNSQGEGAEIAGGTENREPRQDQPNQPSSEQLGARPRVVQERTRDSGQQSRAAVAIQVEWITEFLCQSCNEDLRRRRAL